MVIFLFGRRIKFPLVSPSVSLPLPPSRFRLQTLLRAAAALLKSIINTWRPRSIYGRSEEEREDVPRWD